MTHPGSRPNNETEAEDVDFTPSQPSLSRSLPHNYDVVWN